MSQLSADTVLDLDLLTSLLLFVQPNTNRNTEEGVAYYKRASHIYQKWENVKTSAAGSSG